MNRQVPAAYAIIGKGRVATHFCHYFDLLGLRYQQWHRQQPFSRLTEILTHASHVLVLISDSQIDPFIEQQLAGKHTVVHFSGAHISDAAFTAHPLQTFPLTLYTLEQYQQIPFIIEIEGLPFADLLPGVPNPHYAIKRSQKPLYHALCVMANNFTTLLWQKLITEFETTLGIEASAITPILKQTFANLDADPANALTGPIARGDKTTLTNNLNALRGDSFHAIFNAFINAHEVTHDRT
ncbi:MAG: stilbene synthase [Coxiella sp. (in: Bacteria)]|nr:MAG: stilbene synthase [Coxiella sp. (in: g-proteobacteria)]